jgi:hypothetical protein
MGHGSGVTNGWRERATGRKREGSSDVRTDGPSLALARPVPTSRSQQPSFIATHGAERLPTVTIAAYNAELRDDEGFVGDRASNRAFRAILEDWRERLRQFGYDPLGEIASDEISKKKLDKILLEGDPEAAGLVQGAIEDFAAQLAMVTSRLLRLKAWKGVKRIVVGGGLRASRVGELAVGRASVLLKSQGHSLDLVPIRHAPDHAGLLGTLHLAPSWIFTGYGGVLAVDIGGSNVRVGIVEHHLKKAEDLSESEIRISELWRHVEDKPKRDEAVEKIVKMLRGLVARAAKEELSLAPFVGVGCPGVIDGDGAIARGAQNLPGNWESSKFNLPASLVEQLPQIGEHATQVVMHNDAVVQGLSELPYMMDSETWGILTIGTGLGNACFNNHPRGDEHA